MNDFGVFAAILLPSLTLLWGIRSYQRQMNAQLFLEYTKRFEAVMKEFVKNGWSTRLDSDAKPPRSSKALTLSVLQYLNLCSEEYYLCKGGFLDRKIWGIWEAELIRTMQTRLFIREWKKLSREFESYPAFRDYVDKKQKDSKYWTEK